MKRRIAVKISYESIIKYLGLPEEYEVQEITQSYKDKLCQTVSVIIRSPDGMMIPEATEIPFINLELFLEDLRSSNE